MLVPLNSKKYPGLSAVVDDAFPVSFGYCPSVQGHTTYAVRGLKKPDGTWTTRKLDHDVWEHFNGPIPPGMMIDHVSGVGTDCRLNNLRAVTNRVNMHNIHSAKSSNYPGVCWHKQRRRWVAQITVEGTIVNLGRFTDENRAALAYYQACKMVFDGGRLGGVAA